MKWLSSIMGLFGGAGGLFSSSFLVAILFAGGVYLWNLNSEISRLKIDLLEKERTLIQKGIDLEAQRDNVLKLEESLAKQNDALRALELQLITPEQAMEAQVKIITKYEKIFVTDRTCQAELKAIKDVTKIFFTNP